MSYCDEQDKIGGTSWGAMDCYQAMLCIPQRVVCWVNCTLCSPWLEGDLPWLQIRVMTENLAGAALYQ